MMNKHPTSYWQALPDGRVLCQLCPRECRLAQGQRGLCFVRANQDGQVVLSTYGRSSGFCIDPVEKKPLNHFFPGSPILSFGTAGCNLTCSFCQNWDISKSREMDRLQDQATPEQIAMTAKALHCKSVAFTYNDPVIFLEYAVDTARACQKLGIKTVAVTAGYISKVAMPEFFESMDATNVDLKAFSSDFYKKLCSADIEAVKDTLRFLKKQGRTWLELTTLIIPGQNDSDLEIKKMSRWIYEELGPTVPLHFSAFHPDFRMQNIEATPPATLTRARNIARQEGLKFVYTGNVHDQEGDTTCCASCGKELIVRDWYKILKYSLRPDGSCPSCGDTLVGHFDSKAGDWGNRRLPVQLSDHA